MNLSVLKSIAKDVKSALVGFGALVLGFLLISLIVSSVVCLIHIFVCYATDKQQEIQKIEYFLALIPAMAIFSYAFLAFREIGDDILGIERDES